MVRYTTIVHMYYSGRRPGQYANRLLKPPRGLLIAYISLMSKTTSTPAATYTTLSAIDRVLVAVPRRIESVDIGKCGGEAKPKLLTAEITHFDGKKILVATQIGEPSSHSYDVEVDIYSRKMGKVSYSKTVGFSTTLAWIEQWIEMAQA